ncbi:MAG: hypothetical protein HOP20_11150 [Sulfuriferula sp.]|nr:hypothetical protein [Sulfuriferula sp.]
MNKFWTTTVLASALFAGLQTTVYALEKGAIEVKSIAEVEIKAKNAKGVMETKREPVTLATPGTVVIYTTSFRNVSTKPAGGISIVNPIDKNVGLVAGSVFGDNTDVTYSVDAGKTYAAADKIIVKTAEGRERPALPSDFNSIRWQYKGDLAPNKVGEVGFRAVIK